jgi:TRAP-type C4-dicarboxylate transport system permease small subunit
VKTDSGISFEWWNSLYFALARFFVYFSSALLCAMAFMVTVDVTMRYFFNSPLPASVEICQLIEPWVIFLPFAYTLTIGGHVQVTLFTMRLPKKWRFASDIFAYSIDFIFFSLLCYFSWVEFSQSFAIGEIMLAAIKLPWWSGKLAMPLGSFLIALQCIFQILSVLKKLKEK